MEFKNEWNFISIAPIQLSWCGRGQLYLFPFVGFGVELSIDHNFPEDLNLQQHCCDNLKLGSVFYAHVQKGLAKGLVCLLT